MSSIAYVTDQKMADYFRLCGSREINFWRLSTRSSFRSFKPGDLLFFYTRLKGMREKGLVGYAHFASVNKLSVRQMWKRYGTGNGYETIELLQDAIQKAARDRVIPDKLNCLYLTDVVFFNEPVMPSEVGIYIDKNLESYQYLDREDPRVTARILAKAAEKGIDVWSASQSYAPEDVFRNDETRHRIAVICREIGESGRNESENRDARRLAKARLKQTGWSLIRGSDSDCICIEDDTLHIAIPFVYRPSNKDIRLKEWIGTIYMYKLKIDAGHLPVSNVKYEVLSDNEEEELLPLLKVLNNE